MVVCDGSKAIETKLNQRTRCAVLLVKGNAKWNERDYLPILR